MANSVVAEGEGVHDCGGEECGEGAVEELDDSVRDQTRSDERGKRRTRPSHPDCCRAESQRLEYVRAPLDSAVEINLAVIEYLRLVTTDLKEGLDGGRSALELAASLSESETEISLRASLHCKNEKDDSPTAMVTEIDALDSKLDAQRSILGALDALDDDGQLVVRHLANPGDVVPVELGVDVAEHGGSERGGGRSGRRSGSGGGAVGGNRRKESR